VRINTDRFGDVKEFFNVVQAGDDGQAIFQQQAAAAAQQ
jgi:hypothetical protein